MVDSFNLTVAVIVFLISNLAFVYMVGRKNSGAEQQASPMSDKKMYQLCLLLNIAGGIIVGAVISIAVLFSPEPSYFLMPLILAPFGYWISFGIPILVTLFAVKKTRKNSEGNGTNEA